MNAVLREAPPSDAELIDAAPESDAGPPADAMVDGGGSDFGLVDGGADASLDAGQPRRMFATGGGWQGGLSGTSSEPMSGIAAADRLCNAIAVELSLGGPSWRAWLSDSVEGDAVDRMVGEGPWVNMAGETVFPDRNALKNAAPLATLAYNEMGMRITSGATTPSGHLGFWTGTAPGGASTSDTCIDWTTSFNTSSGTVGDLASNATNWSAIEVLPCTTGMRILCVEQ
ncbi:MAG: hypothetical protein IPK60_18470 [Sandaracinaceae bacterium]|nr:hypothetical protein [Sandaracinaceae bacterium]